MSGLGTITEAQRDTTESGEWSNDYGTYHVWRVVIDADGKTVKTVVNRKVKEDGESKDPTGEQAELKNGKWKVAQTQGQVGGQSNQGGNRSGGGGKSFQADPAKLRAENRRSALHCAAGIAPEGTPSADVLKVAQLFWEWVEA